MDKIIVRSGDAELEIDFKRFLFGDGEWVVTVRGTSFSLRSRRHPWRTEHQCLHPGRSGAEWRWLRTE